MNKIILIAALFTAQAAVAECRVNTTNYANVSCEELNNMCEKTATSVADGYFWYRLDPNFKIETLLNTLQEAAIDQNYLDYTALGLAQSSKAKAKAAVIRLCTLHIKAGAMK